MLPNDKDQETPTQKELVSIQRNITVYLLPSFVLALLQTMANHGSKIGAILSLRMLCDYTFNGPEIGLMRGKVIVEFLMRPEHLFSFTDEQIGIAVDDNTNQASLLNQ